jgi:hypothetical protein
MNNDAITAVVLLIEKYKKQVKIYDVWYETFKKAIDEAEKLKDVIEDLEQLKDVLKKQRY